MTKTFNQPPIPSQNYNVIFNFGVQSISLSPRFILRTLCVIAVFVVLVSFVLAAVRLLVDIDPEGSIAGIMDRFDVDRELSLPTWIASAILLFTAVLAVLIARLPGTRSLDRWGWYVLALSVLAISMDEVAGFHDGLNNVLEGALGTEGLLRYPWVLVGIPLLILITVLMLPMLRNQPRYIQRLLLLTAVIYFGGALATEMLGGIFLAWWNNRWIGMTMYHFEELLELIGASLLLYTLLVYLRQFTGQQPASAS